MSDLKVVGQKEKALSKHAKAEVGAKARGGGNRRSPEELQQTIMVAAYYLSECRNFSPGHELDDWLNAEAQVLAEMEDLNGFRPEPVART
jgi:hypothetical protein